MAGFHSCLTEEPHDVLIHLVLVVCPGNSHAAQLVDDQPVHVRVADAATELLLEEHQNVLSNLFFMTKGNRNMPESKDCILRHQLSVLRLVLLGVQPVGHREDERLDNVLLVSPHPRPQSLAKVLDGGVSQFLEGDQSCVRLLCFLHSRRHILVAVRHFDLWMIEPCRLLTAAIQLSQDVAWVDQEVPQTTDGLLRHDRVFL